MCLVDDSGNGAKRKALFPDQAADFSNALDIGFGVESRAARRTFRGKQSVFVFPEPQRRSAESCLPADNADPIDTSDADPPEAARFVQ
jgi:hypothetical protein